jgi:hypothetical protein
LPDSQFGSSNDTSGMMPRLPQVHELLNDALVAISSKRALLVE